MTIAEIDYQIKEYQEKITSLKNQRDRLSYGFAKGDIVHAKNPDIGVKCWQINYGTDPVTYILKPKDIVFEILDMTKFNFIDKNCIQVVDDSDSKGIYLIHKDDIEHCHYLTIYK